MKNCENIKKMSFKGLEKRLRNIFLQGYTVESNKQYGNHFPNKWSYAQTMLCLLFLLHLSDGCILHRFGQHGYHHPQIYGPILPFAQLMTQIILLLT